MNINHKCKICDKLIEDQNDSVKLREKGAVGVNEASLLRGGNVSVTTGDFVHKSCRSSYINKKYFTHSKSQEQSCMNTRMHTKPFNFKTHCFLCTNAITVRNKQNREYSCVSCKNNHVDKAIEKAFQEREMDEWAMEVKCRVASISSLFAVEAVYHKDCYTRFRTKKKKGNRNSVNT